MAHTLRPHSLLSNCTCRWFGPVRLTRFASLGLLACLGGALFALLPRPAAASPSTHVFALVVTNNKSVTLSQPDLQYADDDGARYYQLFRSVAAEPDVVLLTTFDRASATIYSDLSKLARAPTRSQVELAAARLGDAVSLARRRGEPTSFYFIYAGHGDMDDGRGTLELEDGRIDGTFIEHQILDRVPADNKHLLLDSCNSFFVINPRKPGGRRWATPKDMAIGFSARHPEVGLFLSTNSDSEVFEWSEIESGVFSHEVRSGLTGAADVNGDGTISYSELAGFVENANSGIAREILRPHLFYRGPRGNSNAALFPQASMIGRKIALADSASRLWIKNATGGRILDVHKEPGMMTLIVPDGIDQELFVYEEYKGDLKSRSQNIERRITPGTEPVQLASLDSRKPEVGSRGDTLFGSLFATPYGPVAYAQYLKTSAAAPEPVYGLTQADLSRMHNYLSAMAGQDRATQTGLGISMVGLGVFAGSVAVGLSLDHHDRHAYPAGIAIAGALGAGLIGSGLYYSLSPSSGERALATFEQELAVTNGNGALAFVKTEEWLTKMAARERRIRNAGFWFIEAVGLGAVTLATVTAISPPADTQNRAIGPAMLYSEGALLMTLGFLFRTMTTPTERMLNLYHDDPTLKLHFGVAATPSGMSLGLSGAF